MPHSNWIQDETQHCSFCLGQILYNLSTLVKYGCLCNSIIHVDPRKNCHVRQLLGIFFYFLRTDNKPKSFFLIVLSRWELDVLINTISTNLFTINAIWIEKKRKQNRKIKCTIWFDLVHNPQQLDHKKSGHLHHSWIREQAFCDQG